MKPKSESFWRAGFGKGKDTERQQSYEAGTSETVSPCAILPGVKEEKVGPFICDRPHDLAKKILEFRIRELRFSFCCLPFSVLSVSCSPLFSSQQAHFLALRSSPCVLHQLPTERIRMGEKSVTTVESFSTMLFPIFPFLSLSILFTGLLIHCRGFINIPVHNNPESDLFLHQ